MNQKYYSLKDIAKLIEVSPHQISYALSNGSLREPMQISNRRMFSESDVRAAREYFANRHTTTKAGTK
jgi:DNA-binding transcriptional MerR regulator